MPVRAVTSPVPAARQVIRAVGTSAALLLLAGARAAAQGAPAPGGAPDADACDPERLRSFGELQGRLRASVAMAGANPAARPSRARGYLGVQLSEVSATAWTPEGRVVRYCAYPLVVSVEPASPAERAGVDAGDTVVAYGAHDLVRAGPVALDQLLVPGTVVRMRLRRAGRTLTRDVTVGRAPAPQIVTLRGGDDRAGSEFGPALGTAFTETFRQSRVTSTGDTWVRVVVGPTGPDSARHAGRTMRVTTTGASAKLARELAAEGRSSGGFAPEDRTPLMIVDGVPVRAFAPAAPTAPHEQPPRPLLNYLRALPPVPATAWSTSAPSTLAGAQLIALDDDLREVLARGAGADPDAGPVRGVFVLKVLPGPAASAGLRAGDVVTAADGRLVASPAALQRVLAGRALGAGAAERRAVPLRVWRAGAARDVVLRW